MPQAGTMADRLGDASGGRGRAVGEYGFGGFCSVNRPIVTSPKRGAKRLKRQVDWLVNGTLTGPIFSRVLNQLTQLEIFPARDKDWPVNERYGLLSTT